MSIHVLIDDVVTEVYPAIDVDELPIVEDGLPICNTADDMPVRVDTVTVVAAPHGSPEWQAGDAALHHSPVPSQLRQAPQMPAGESSMPSTSTATEDEEVRPASLFQPVGADVEAELPQEVQQEEQQEEQQQAQQQQGQQEQ
ncbi:hypothetical protein MRX96_027940 [Rhipicephalus microplus]